MCFLFRKRTSRNVPLKSCLKNEHTPKKRKQKRVTFDIEMHSFESELPLLPQNSRTLSRQRARFIILSVFDLTLAFILWLLWTVTKSDDWKNAFLEEINILDPNFIHHSLFDIVAIAFLRFVWLVTSYGLCRAESTLFVIFTTLVTTIYVIIKVLFFFSKEQSGVPQYFIVLSSLLISWFELWDLPFKVLRQERAFTHVIDNDVRIVQSARPHPPTHGHDHGRAPYTAHIVSENEYVSALDNESSDEQSGQGSLAAGHMIHIDPKKVEIFKKMALESLNNCIQFVNAEIEAVSSWKVMKKDHPEVRLSAAGVYYIKETFGNISMAELFSFLWERNELWNNQVESTRQILAIDGATQIVHSISAPALRKIITPRDFIDIRLQVSDTERNCINGYFVNCDDGIGNFIPSDRDVTRGSNGPSLMRVTTTSENFVVFEWIMQCDLRGSLPKALVQRSMVNFFATCISNLHKICQISRH